MHAHAVLLDPGVCDHRDGVTHEQCTVDTTDYHCWCAVSSSLLLPFCSVAVQRRSVTVSTSAVTHSRRRFFSAEGELLHTHAHAHTRPLVQQTAPPAGHLVTH